MVCLHQTEGERTCINFFMAPVDSRTTSKRDRRQANVREGACRSCRNFIANYENLAAMRAASLSQENRKCCYVRRSPDVEVGKQAGCVVCRVLFDTDHQRSAYANRCWSRDRLGQVIDVNERNYWFLDHGKSFEVFGDWDAWDSDLQYSIYICITAAKGMSPGA
jgi:hypothetical protein